MKILRFIYMILATILLSPLIIIILIGGLFVIIGFELILKYKYDEPINNCIIEGIRYWISQIKLGIEMNIDFIQNGLKIIGV